MNYTSGNGAKIYYETMGPADGLPVLLIQGFSAQMIGWRNGFCQKLVERGFRVIRFDNRDVGLSEKFGGADDVDGGYSLADLAADSFGVLDALDLSSAHVVGQSMGGMIAQIMADTRPERVRSLSLVYTAPGFEQRHFGVAIENASIAPSLARLARQDAIEAYVMQERHAGSTAYPFNETWIRQLGALAFDRCYAPDGHVRQWQAMLRAPNSFADLERLAMPVSVIHGRDDGLIKASASLEFGARIPQAEVHIYPGMGHEVVEPLWDEFANIIHRTALRAA
ncbi:MAG: alpha/beta hydrolase [Pseudomonadota bacterium]